MTITEATAILFAAWQNGQMTADQHRDRNMEIRAKDCMGMSMTKHSREMMVKVRWAL